MTKWQRLRPKLAKVCESFQLMAFGAYLLALYLYYADPTDAWMGRNLSSFMLLILGLNALAAWLRPRKPADEEVSVVKLAPKWSGIAVILATGLTAAFATVIGIGLGFTGSETPLVAAAIVVVTIIAAIAMWRFASAYESEIGEARFTPSAD